MHCLAVGYLVVNQMPQVKERSFEGANMVTPMKKILCLFISVLLSSAVCEAQDGASFIEWEDWTRRGLTQAELGEISIGLTGVYDGNWPTDDADSPPGVVDFKRGSDNRWTRVKGRAEPFAGETGGLDDLADYFYSENCDIPSGRSSRDDRRTKRESFTGKVAWVIDLGGDTQNSRPPGLKVIVGSCD